MILSGALMLEHIGWKEAADRIYQAVNRVIAPAHGHQRTSPPRWKAPDQPSAARAFGEAIINNL